MFNFFFNKRYFLWLFYTKHISGGNVLWNRAQTWPFHVKFILNFGEFLSIEIIHLKPSIVFVSICILLSCFAFYFEEISNIKFKEMWHLPCNKFFILLFVFLFNSLLNIMLHFSKLNEFHYLNRFCLHGCIPSRHTNLKWRLS